MYRFSPASRKKERKEWNGCGRTKDETIYNTNEGEEDYLYKKEDQRKKKKPGTRICQDNKTRN